jgi:hypothetical protein
MRVTGLQGQRVSRVCEALACRAGHDGEHLEIAINPREHADDPDDRRDGRNPQAKVWIVLRTGAQDMATTSETTTSLTTRTSPALEIATAFTTAWTSHHLPQAAEFVADDVEFEGPLAQTQGSAAYLKGLAGLARDITGFRMLAAFADGDQALLMYDLHTRSYGTLTCAKLLTIRDGKIARDKLTFDSHLIRSAKAA